MLAAVNYPLNNYVWVAKWRDNGDWWSIYTSSLPSLEEPSLLSFSFFRTEDLALDGLIILIYKVIVNYVVVEHPKKNEIVICKEMDCLDT
jgi:hypothetical protein